MLLRVKELMRRRPMPTLFSSKRLSKERQPVSMLWRASPEMLTPYKVSCLRCGKFRDGAEKFDMVTLDSLSSLRCGKFRDCAAGKSGKRQPPKLATWRVGAKQSADGGSRGREDGKESSAS
jgi:hypothetical protein